MFLKQRAQMLLTHICTFIASHFFKGSMWISTAGFWCSTLPSHSINTRLNLTLPISLASLDCSINLIAFSASHFLHSVLLFDSDTSALRVDGWHALPDCKDKLPPAATSFLCFMEPLSHGISVFHNCTHTSALPGVVLKQVLIAGTRQLPYSPPDQSPPVDPITCNQLWVQSVLLPLSRHAFISLFCISFSLNLKFLLSFSFFVLFQLLHCFFPLPS